MLCFVIVFQVVSETWGSRVKDYTLYTGVLGTAYLVFKAYEVTKNLDDLNLCLKIVEACDSASVNSRYSPSPCDYASVNSRPILFSYKF